MYSRTPNAGASRGFTSPHTYIQGPGELGRLFAYTHRYGRRAFLVIDRAVESLIKSVLEQTAPPDEPCLTEAFFGYSSRENVEMLAEKARAFGTDVVVGIGGGSCLDTVKMLSDEIDRPRVIVPTAASNDGPAADWAGRYTHDGKHISGGPTRRSTELILVDSEIICTAPVRLLSAGIGDALSTYFEARAVAASDSETCVGPGLKQSLAGVCLAESCYRTLINRGEEALEAAREHQLCDALEDVIEACLLLSGLGFINGGLAAAHGLHAGISQLPGAELCLHGEKVAFCLLCQLALEQTDEAQIRDLMAFLHRVNLPVTLAELGIKASEENLDVVAEHCTEKNILIYTEPLAVSKDRVKAAIWEADRMGRAWLAGEVRG